MSDGPKIIRPYENFNPGPQNLAYNASRWAQIAKEDFNKQRIKNIGFIFMFFPRDAIGQAKGVVVANVNQEAMKDEMRAAVKRWGDQRKILMPGEDF